MFGNLYHLAQSAIDDAIDQLAGRIAVVITFLIALAFATAAASMRLTLEFGAETADLILAGCCAILGLLLVTILIAKSRKSPAPAANPAASDAQASDEVAAQNASGMSAADRELLLASLTSLAPVAASKFLSFALRTLPVIALIVILIFLITQGSNATRAADAAASHQPVS
jgi:glycopeptide antibiotics resistance protein